MNRSSVAPARAAALKAAGFSNASAYALDGVTGRASGALTVAPFAAAGSMSLWINPDAALANGNYDVLACGNGAFLAIQRVAPDLYVRWLWADSLNNEYTGLVAVASPFEYCRLTLTWTQGGSARLYRNGTVIAGPTALGSNPMRTTVNTAFLARAAGWLYSGYLKALVDEAAWWSVALSAPEEAALAAAGKPANLLAHTQAASLKAWWRADGNVLPTVTDASGNGVTGTATAGVTLSAVVP